MLANLVRVKILTDALASVASVWIRAWLTSHQSANKKYHSTETLNVTVTDEFLEAMDKKMLSAMVLLDLPKAFDSIDHTILLHRLANAGASPLL